MSPPPNLLIRGGASRLAKEHASQSVFIQRMGRCAAVWREWQRVHTIGHSANCPWLRSLHERYASAAGNRLRDSGEACRARVSVPERDRPSAWCTPAAREDRSYQRRCRRLSAIALSSCRCYDRAALCYRCVLRYTGCAERRNLRPPFSTAAAGLYPPS